MVNMTLGSYSFDPVPQVTLSIAPISTQSGEIINRTRQVQLEGLLTTSSISCGGGIVPVISLKEDLENAVNLCNECTLFTLTCSGDGGEYTLLEGYPRSASIQFSPTSDNWTQTIGYSITMEWDGAADASASGCDSCLAQTDESWSIQPLDNNFRYDWCGESNPTYLSVTHELTAQGNNCCISGVMSSGWENAKTWVESRLGWDSNVLTSEPLGLGVLTFEACNHTRVISKSPTGGTYGVNENWILIGSSGNPRCLEEFTVECTENNESRFTQVSVRGTLTGLEKRDANFNITTTKFASAETSWLAVEPLLSTRAACAACDMDCTLNTTPLSKSILLNPVSGIISYDYSFNDRPTTLIPNAKVENVNISDSFPSDIIGEVGIPGRLAGPLLFSCNTPTARRRSVDISAILSNSGCPDGVDYCTRWSQYLAQDPTASVNEFLCCIQSTLESGYDTVYKTEDTGSFDPINGTYSRRVSWTFQNCSGVETTGFC